MDVAGGLDAREHAGHRRRWYAPAALAPVGNLDRCPTRCHARLRGALRPPAPPHHQGAGRPLRGLASSRIVDAYLAELERMQALDLDVATEFLLIAATLVELKTRRLLPGPRRRRPRRGAGLWEERDLLLARLLECKTFKDAAARARAHGRRRPTRSLPRRAGLEERFLEPDARPAGGRHARASCASAFLRGGHAQAAAARVDLDHVAPIRIERAGRGRGAGRRAAPGRAHHVPPTSPPDLVERLEVIVRFLAVLELFKQGLVDLDQAGTSATSPIIVDRRRRRPRSSR